MNSAAQPDAAELFQQFVAANVRAELSRARWSGRQAAMALGFTQPYVSRRLTGGYPMDVNDLKAFATLLDIPIARFFEGDMSPEATEGWAPSGSNRRPKD